MPFNGTDVGGFFVFVVFTTSYTLHCMYILALYLVDPIRMRPLNKLSQSAHGEHSQVRPPEVLEAHLRSKYNTKKIQTVKQRYCRVMASTIRHVQESVETINSNISADAQRYLAAIAKTRD